MWGICAEGRILGDGKWYSGLYICVWWSLYTWVHLRVCVCVWLEGHIDQEVDWPAVRNTETGEC